MEEDEGFMKGKEDELGFDDDDDDDDAGSSDFRDHVELKEDDSYSRDREDIDDFQYQVLTPDGIVQLMVDTIREVSNVVKLPATVTRILLNHFKWDKEKLMERLYGGDPDAVFTEAHVINPHRHAQQSKVDTVPSVAVKENCEICCCTVLGSSMTGIECNHQFCEDCWTEYLTTKIMEEGMGQTITCAAHECDILVDDITVMKLVKESKVKLKYQHMITNSFVHCNRLMRWCPAPDCPNAFKVYYIEQHPVTCNCAHTCCFVCGNNWHDPVKCWWLKKWKVEKKDYERKKHDRDSKRKKHDDDNKTLNWIEDKIKECPKCHVPIEKDGGCNRMVCRTKNCKAEFCWTCLGPWELSSSHACNRYKDEDARANNNQAQEGQAPDAPGEPDAPDEPDASERFLFYYNRHMNHLQSLRFENKLNAQIKLKMEEMQQHKMRWIEVQFLKKAVDVLCQCRSTLMYTYVFAFYLKKNNQSLIFEENQNILENATETLSEYLERGINFDAPVEIWPKVKDKSRLLKSGRKNLVEHVHEGYEKNFWEYYDE